MRTRANRGRGIAALLGVLLLSCVCGCTTFRMRPAWRLDDQQQAKVEAAWDSILAHSDQIDRSLLLDLLIVGDLPELGVDEIDLTARKRLSGGGIAVMETH